VGVLGAAAAATTYEGPPPGDPCVREREVQDPYGNVTVRTVRVC
jgi:hypothetical protein